MTNYWLGMLPVFFSKAAEWRLSDLSLYSLSLSLGIKRGLLLDWEP